MIKLFSVHPRLNMLSLKRKRTNGLDKKNVKIDEKIKINDFYVFFEKMDTMVSIFNLKKFLNVPVKIIKKYNFFRKKMSSDGGNSTSTKIFSEAATAPSMVELPTKSDTDSFATRSSVTVEDWAEKEQALDLHEDEDDISAAFTPEINEFFAPVEKPKFVNRTGVKMVFPMSKNRKELLLLGQSSRGKVDKKVSWGVDRKSPEEKRAESRKLKEKPVVKNSSEKKEMVAVEGVMQREKKTEIKRRFERNSSTSKKSKNDASWGNGAKNTNDWGFSCTDYRYRDKKPEKALAVPMGSAKKTSDKKELAKSVALLVKDVKVPKTPEPAKKNVPWKKRTEMDRALKRGSPPVVTFDPIKRASASNPVLSADKNGPEVGKKYKHENYNKKAKDPVDAEIQTEPIKARHVQLGTATRVGPTIVDPDQYILETFCSYEKVPELEAEVELQKIQRNAVEHEFRVLKAEKRALEVCLNGARKERDDALGAEKEALEEKEEALRTAEFWKKKAGVQREAKNKLKVANKGLHEKVVGKVIRALERLNLEVEFEGETDGGKMMKEKMTELVSKDTVEQDFSSDDLEC